MIVSVFYDAQNFTLPSTGEPVGMNIEKTHENANHQATIMEIFVLIYFLNNDNFAVSGSDNYLFCFVGFRETA